MPSQKEILYAIRQLRNAIMARKSHGDVRDKLKYQCDRITELDTPGEDWASPDMPDPLFPNEYGHSV